MGLCWLVRKEVVAAAFFLVSLYFSRLRIAISNINLSVSTESAIELNETDSETIELIQAPTMKPILDATHVFICYPVNLSANERIL